ncbi:GDYXXLXY domain-containing protein [Nostoc sp. LPT]|uniref:GDYXXLXY domain-containing protein n=1 Tax=Nostoc sp. LPT TaxID=2815387 RepID=UPI001DB2FA61|nr:GDYXXLXY domain-containing protein [Nostoc sp. LPT]MBN4000833.1 GDYXXLXY domain-containing protein [Nostoc sp. LPT]
METNQALPLQNEPSQKPIALWRFVVPLLIQTAIILAVPAQSVYTLVTGKTAILQTLPVDPYDLLRGYSVTLNYQISRIDNLKKLPGWEDLVKQNPVPDKRGEPLAQGTNLYIILEEQKSSSGIPQAWKPVRVSGQFPTSLAANQIALKGQYSGYNSITYGLETYYIPEDQRNNINNDISKARSIKPGQPQPIVVEVKVNAQGKAIPINMWVRDRKYHF